MSEFTCTKRSDDAFFFVLFFCYFCLKAGADRSGVRGTRQKEQFYSTVLGFHHITKRERSRQMVAMLRKRDLYIKDLFSTCTSGVIETLDLQHSVRTEAL